MEQKPFSNYLKKRHSESVIVNKQTILVSFLLSFTNKSGAKAFSNYFMKKHSVSVNVNKQTFLESFV